MPNKVLLALRWSALGTAAGRLAGLGLLAVITGFVSTQAMGVFQLFSQCLSLVLVLSFFSTDYAYLANLVTGRTAAVTGFVLSLIWGLFLYIAAPWLSGLLHSPALEPLLRGLCFLPVLEAWRRSLKIYRQKYLGFKRTVLAENANLLFYSLLLMALVAFVPAARSPLIITGVFYLGNLLEIILLMPPAKEIAAKIAGLSNVNAVDRYRNHLGFLLYTTLNHVAGFFADSAPNFILAMYFAPGTVGLYFMASRVAFLPVGMLGNAAAQVFLPALAGQTPVERGRNLERYTRFCLSFGWPLLLIFCYVLSLGLPLFLKGDWADCTPHLLWLFWPAATTLLVNPLSVMLIITKKTHWETAWTLASLTFRCAAMLVAVPWGVVAVVAAFSVASSISHIFLYGLIFRSANIHMGNLFPALTPFFITLLLTAVGLFMPLWVALSLVLPALFCIWFLDYKGNGLLKKVLIG